MDTIDPRRTHHAPIEGEALQQANIGCSAKTRAVVALAAAAVLAIAAYALVGQLQASERAFQIEGRV